MKNIRKFVSLCLAAVMLISMFAFVACDNKNDDKNNDSVKDIPNYQSTGTNSLGQVYYNKNLFTATLQCRAVPTRRLWTTPTATATTICLLLQVSGVLPTLPIGKKSVRCSFPKPTS